MARLSSWKVRPHANVPYEDSGGLVFNKTSVQKRTSRPTCDASCSIASLPPHGRFALNVALALQKVRRSERFAANATYPIASAMRSNAARLPTKQHPIPRLDGIFAQALHSGMRVPKHPPALVYAFVCSRVDENEVHFSACVFWVKILNSIRRTVRQKNLFILGNSARGDDPPAS